MGGLQPRRVGTAHHDYHDMIDNTQTSSYTLKNGLTLIIALAKKKPVTITAAHFFKTLTQEDVWPIRHVVLRPDDPLDFIKVPRDKTALHLGLVVQGQIVSVLSLFEDQPLTLMRKFATLPEHQSKGYGAKLIEHALIIACDWDTNGMWCNARKPAQRFYRRHGFVPAGDDFLKNDMVYTRMEHRF